MKKLFAIIRTLSLTTVYAITHGFRLLRTDFAFRTPGNLI